MSIKEKYSVKRIKKNQTHDWILNKHYAKRLPSISFAFGLFDNDILVGVLTIGKPASPSLCVGICGEKWSHAVYELNRLVTNDDLDKNALSYFVSKALSFLRAGVTIVVSYADTDMGHNGYIYQATNWIYTGKTKERTDIGTNDGSHSRHYDKSLDYSENRVKRSSKHRYVYFCGQKRWIKKAMNEFKYKQMPYPKGENERYDASYKPQVQTTLF